MFAGPPSSDSLETMMLTRIFQSLSNLVGFRQASKKRSGNFSLAPIQHVGCVCVQVGDVGVLVPGRGGNTGF